MKKIQQYVIEEGMMHRPICFSGGLKIVGCLEAAPDVLMAVMFVYLNTVMSEQRHLHCSFTVAASDWIGCNQFL